MNLFFLPFAGASSYSYNGFEKIAPSEINIKVLELPGRGRKIKGELLILLY